MKKFFSSTLSRVLVAALLMLLQLAVLMLMLLVFDEYYVFFSAISIVVSTVTVLYIVGCGSHPAYKIAWIIVVMLLPIFGGLFYVLFGRSHLTRRECGRLARIGESYERMVWDDEGAVDALEAASRDAAIQSNYLRRAANAPVFRRTEVEFLPIGEAMYARMMEELEKAEKFIFLEYFIIQAGVMWDPMLALLERKAAAGVDVRVLYDDLGCLFTLPKDYDRQLEARGIKACIFNKFKPSLNSRFNNRDHRKICVVDGNVGFTGGINLADEYINAYAKHGHWLDCGVLLRGDAVRGLTALYLSMWDFLRGEADDDFTAFAPDPALVASVRGEGFAQPFTDMPLDDETVGETVYMNILGRARDYVYICTPYLIIDNEMITALTTAAKSGIDVRLMTPHIPDKKIVFAMTRSNYKPLLEAGVKIYEYTPGFVHSKTFVCDDSVGVVGSINLDYRSLFLHFECGVWLYGCAALRDIKANYLENLEKCQEIDLAWYRKLPWYSRAVSWLLRAFAPLL